MGQLPMRWRRKPSFQLCNGGIEDDKKFMNWIKIVISFFDNYYIWHYFWGGGDPYSNPMSALELKVGHIN